MNIREKIIDIIHLGPKAEPATTLESKYFRLTDEIQKEEFLSVIKDLVLNGSENEQLVSLYVIRLIEEAKKSGDVIKELVEKFDYEKDEKLLSSLLFLCAELSTGWSISFIKETMRHFKPETKEYIYSFDMGLRSIVDSLYWKDAIDDIKWAIENYDDVNTADLVAYFMWRRNRADLKELINLIKSDKPIYDRIASLEDEIVDRYVNGYGGQVK
ncbi:MAG: hypothetical protein LBS20_03970 [Prevotella sp.]|jgi:hypothetical protein|nr:hypothetical protein [Prevotella sp.]